MSRQFTQVEEDVIDLALDCYIETLAKAEEAFPNAPWAKQSHNRRLIAVKVRDSLLHPVDQ